MPRKPTVGDLAERSVIQNHPGLLWKAQNVRQHLAGV
jgi:hypothetical protein